MTIQFPPARQPIAGGSVVDPNWERWFGDLARAVNDAGTTTEVPPVEYPSFVINGAGSVTASGAVEAGEFVVTLEGDKDNPPPNSFYGADTTGNKGFVPLYDGLEEGEGIALLDSGYTVIDTVASPDDLPLTGNAGEAVRVTDDEPGIYAWDGSAFTLDPAATGIVNVALAPLADAGTGTTLKKIVRDAYGRVSATEAANASDVPYDPTTSGLAADDVQDAIDELAIAAGVGSLLTVMLADSPSALWKCDEATGTTLADSSGNGNDLTLTGSYTPAFSALTRAAPSNQYVRFASGNNGAARSGKLGLTAPFNFDYTIATIVLPLTVSTTERIILLAISGSGETAAGNYQCRLALSPTDLEIESFWEYSTGTNLTVGSGIKLDLGRAHMIHMRKNTSSKTLSFFLDGRHVSSQAYSNEPTGGTAADMQVTLGYDGVSPTVQSVTGWNAFFPSGLSDERIAAHAIAAGFM